MPTLAPLLRFAWLLVVAVAATASHVGQARAASGHLRHTVVIELGADPTEAPSAACVVTTKRRGPATLPFGDWRTATWIATGSTDVAASCNTSGALDTRLPCHRTHDILTRQADATSSAASTCTPTSGDSCRPRLQPRATGVGSEWVACARDPRAPDDGRVVFLLLDAAPDSALVIHDIQLDAGVVRMSASDFVVGSLLTRVLGGDYLPRSVDGSSAVIESEAGGRRTELLELEITPNCRRREVRTLGSNDGADAWSFWGERRTGAGTRVEPEQWCSRREGSRLYVDVAEPYQPGVDSANAIATGPGGDIVYRGTYVESEDSVVLGATAFRFSWSRDLCTTPDEVCPRVEPDDPRLTCEPTTTGPDEITGRCEYECEASNVAAGDVGLAFPQRVTFSAADGRMRWTDVIQRPGHSSRSRVPPPGRHVLVDLTPWIVKSRHHRVWQRFDARVRALLDACEARLGERTDDGGPARCMPDDASEAHACLDRCARALETSRATHPRPDDAKLTAFASDYAELEEALADSRWRDEISTVVTTDHGERRWLDPLARLERRRIRSPLAKPPRAMGVRDRAHGRVERIDAVILTDAQGARHSIDPSSAADAETLVAVPNASCGQRVRVEVVGTREYEPSSAEIRHGRVEIDPPERSVRTSRIDLALAVGSAFSPRSPDDNRVEPSVEGIVEPGLSFSTPVSWLGIDVGLAFIAGSYPYFPATVGASGLGTSERVPHGRVGMTLLPRILLNRASIAAGGFFGLGVPLRPRDLDKIGVQPAIGMLAELTYRVGPRLSFVIMGRLLGGERVRAYRFETLFGAPRRDDHDILSGAIDLGVRFHIARPGRQ